MIYELIRFAQVNINNSEVDIPQSSLSSTSLHTILQIVFGAAGGVALIVIIIAGMRFILSQGDPNNVTKARNTIIYAVIGLIICIAAFSIVTFVLTNTQNKP